MNPHLLSQPPCKISPYMERKFCKTVLQDHLLALNRLGGPEWYFVDYSNEKVYFLDSHSKFLCGYPAEQLQIDGLAFFAMLSPPTETAEMRKMYTSVSQILNASSFEKRKKMKIECHLSVINAYGKAQIQHHVILP